MLIKFIVLYFCMIYKDMFFLSFLVPGDVGHEL